MEKREHEEKTAAAQTTKLQHPKIEEKVGQQAASLDAPKKSTTKESQPGKDQPKRKVKAEKEEDNEKRFNAAYVCGAGANPELPSTWKAWLE